MGKLLVNCLVTNVVMIQCKVYRKGAGTKHSTSQCSKLCNVLHHGVTIASTFVGRLAASLNIPQPEGHMWKTASEALQVLVHCSTWFEHNTSLLLPAVPSTMEGTKGNHYISMLDLTHGDGRFGSNGISVGNLWHNLADELPVALQCWAMALP